MDRSPTFRFDVLTAGRGFVDAAGFVTLVGIVTAHLSGDTTHLAVAATLQPASAPEPAGS